MPLLLILGGVAAGVMLLGCAGIVALITLMPENAIPRVDEFVDAQTRAAIADSAHGPELTADPKASAQLGPRIVFGDHSIQLPDGFAGGTGVVEPLTPEGGQMHGWQWVKGLHSPGEEIALLQAQMREAPATVNGAEYFEQALADELRELRKSNGRLDIESGRHNGKRAVRVTYSSRKDGLACTKLFQFEGERLLVLTMVCSSADQNLVRVLEAAMLSVQESDASGPQGSPRRP
jgi:hypothetical protein